MPGDIRSPETRPSRHECLRHENGFITNSTTSGVLKIGALCPRGGCRGAATTTTQAGTCVLVTAISTAYHCNQLETNQINPEEIVLLDTRKALTEKGVGSIVEKVPRGLRNSKSPET